MNYFNSIKGYLMKIPSALAGLALAIASLGLCWEVAIGLNGTFQVLGAILSSIITIPLILKFLLNPVILKNELQHPVSSSIIPTLTMSAMVIASALAMYSFKLGQIINWIAIIFHLIFFITFIFYRSKSFSVKQVLPSWFIPPIGLVLAVVTHPGGLPTFMNNTLLLLGFGSYIILLPIVLYRVSLSRRLNEKQTPIITILAAPASLLLVAYLATTTMPLIVVLNTLLLIAILMTFYIYYLLINLLRLPFSPAYSAFTFPLVVSAIALFKGADVLLKQDINRELGILIGQLAYVELMIASAMVFYVSFRFLQNFSKKK